MRERQRETEFLRHVILYDGSDERLTLEKRIEQVQRDQRCVQRVLWVIAAILMLSLAGLAYGEILDKSFASSLSDFAFKVLCEALLAALICLVGFAVLFTVYSTKLNRLREECRLLVKKILESRLDKPRVATMPDPVRVS